MSQGQTASSTRLTPARADEVVAEARRWIDTPYRHQAAVRGAGCDCVGLIRGVGLATGLWPHDEAWKRFGAYSRIPNPAHMARGMETFLVPLEGDPRRGDILWLAWRKDLPMHLAICTGAAMIHSYSDIGRVVEHGLTAEWRGRTHSVWGYPA